MSIEVRNFKNGETIRYSLALLNGSIKFTNGRRNINFIFVKNIKTRSLAGFWPVNNDVFKAFVDLELGRNEFILSLNPDDNKSDLHFVLNFLPPKKQKNFVRPVYVICRDHHGCFQGPDAEDCSVESACRRIIMAMRILQSYVAEKLYEQGLGRRTFSLEEDLNTRSPGCHIFHSKLSTEAVQQMTQGELWLDMARELMSSTFFDHKLNCKWMAFLSFTRYTGTNKHGNIPSSHKEILALTKGHAALGGGGLAIYGTGTMYCWASRVAEVVVRMMDGRKIDKRAFMDDSAYRGTHWGNFSTGLGAVLHELCHTFDLGHTPSGIMARGFDDIHQSILSINPSLISSFNHFSSIHPSLNSFFSSPPNNGCKSEFYNKASKKVVNNFENLPNKNNNRINTVINSKYSPGNLPNLDKPIPCYLPTIQDATECDVSSGPASQLKNLGIKTSSLPSPSSSLPMTTCNYDGTVTSVWATKNADNCVNEIEITRSVEGELTLIETTFDPGSRRKKITCCMTLVSATPSSSPTLPPHLTTFLSSRHTHAGSHFHRSSALMLLRHPWLYSCESGCSNLKLEGTTASSDQGLHLIELRMVDTGMVFHHYEFDGDVEDEVDDDDVKDQGEVLKDSADKQRFNKENLIKQYKIKRDDVLRHFRRQKILDGNNNNKVGIEGEEVCVVLMDKTGCILKRKLSLQSFV